MFVLINRQTLCVLSVCMRFRTMYTRSFCICTTKYMEYCVSVVLLYSCDLVADQPMIALIKKFAIFTMYFCTCSCWLLTSSLFLLLFMIVCIYGIFFSSFSTTNVTRPAICVFFPLICYDCGLYISCFFFFYDTIHGHAVTIQANN